MDFCEPGFYTGLSFNSDELNKIRRIIRDSWLNRINDICPQHYNEFSEIEITDYHKLSHLLDHKIAWPKKYRLLEIDDVKIIRKMTVFTQLKNEFGDFKISNEENIKPEEIYWRLVRPDVNSDVGTIHADAWFWELGRSNIPEDHTRVKFWVSIYSEPGENGLTVLPNSHNNKYKYDSVFRDGIYKPNIIMTDSIQNNMSLYQGEPGAAIVFNDNLLHGGRAAGNYTRVSIEFTMIVSNDYIN